MRVLVTGSNGFIGRSICNRLNENHEVIGIGSRSTTVKTTFRYLQANIVDNDFIELMIKNIRQCDVIVHTAALIDKNEFNAKLIDVNCKGTENILQLAQKLKCKRLIHTSSLPVIGKPIMLPITEEHLPAPATLYHITKLTAEYIINQGMKYGVQTFNLRIPSPIGVGMKDNAILSIFIDNALKNKNLVLLGRGSRKQNYIDVRDVALAVECCLESGAAGTFNIASLKAVSNIDLAKLCIKITNSDSLIEFSGDDDLEEDYNWEVSIQKAQNRLKFEPQYKIDDSILDIIKTRD